MNVARGDRITNPKELKAALGIVDQRLRAPVDQGREVELAQIRRFRLQGKVEVVDRQGAVLDDDLIDQSFLAGLVILVVETSAKLVALTLNRCEVEVQGDGGPGIV